MISIFKFVLADSRNTVVEMPKGAKPLSVGFQGDALCVWAEVEPGAKPDEVHFHIVPTGDTVQSGPGKLKFIGTASRMAGAHPYVLHVYQRVDNWQ